MSKTENGSHAMGGETRQAAGVSCETRTLQAGVPAVDDRNTLEMHRVTQDLAGCVTRGFGTEESWRVAVTIPARNEAGRLVSCLDAVAASLGGRGGIVLVVNGSQDETFATAGAWFRSTGTSGILLDDPAPPGNSGVGRARRLAVAACAGRLAPGAAVMTSDADSRVAPDWVDANLSDLAGADLICGDVMPDAAEFARLPAAIGQRGAVEGAYMALTLAAHRLLDPVPWDMELPHLNAAGASLAFRLALYNDLGGFRELQTGEDRAFAADAEARDWRVRYSARAQVVTACRLDGRAPGGMAGALRARITEPDPFVDELLIPAAQTIARTHLRGSLRRQFGGRAGFGAAWAKFEAASPGLQRQRLRLSDLHRELPLLAEALAGLVPGEERRTA